MTSTVVDRPRQPAHRAPVSTLNFIGTLALLRLYLRRDRIVAPLWILLLTVPLASLYVGGTHSVYPTAADRAGAVAAIMASPAQRALYGNVYNDSLGAVGIWKASMFHVLIAVAVILTVIRHTRADEESGRAELLDSTVVGRYAGLTAALAMSFGASAVTGVIACAGLLTADVPASGSLAFALALMCSGLVFTAVAAVAAQLSPSARTARGVAFAALATAFALRALGDATSATGTSVLTWLSPLGWSLQVRPYAGDRWWVLLLHLTATGILTALAYRLRARRDLGDGLLPDRPGPASAAPWLARPAALAWRLDRGAVLLWTIGLCLFGMIMGSVTHGIGGQIGDSGIARDIVERLGGSAAIEQSFIAIAFTILSIVASAFTVSMVLRLHHEESTGHAETLLAGAVDRTRWLTSHLIVALAGSAGALALTGLVAGLTYGAAAGDVTAKLSTTLGTALIQLPAVWLLAAVTVALFGLAPRYTPVAWAVLVFFVAIFLLGSFADFPQWLRGLEPYSHIPHVGTGAFTATPLLWLLAADIALTVLGLATFRRRDLR